MKNDDWIAYRGSRDWLAFYEGDWDDAPDLWEHQGEALTVRDLSAALAGLPDNLPLTLALYTGDGSELRPIAPVEIGFTGTGPQPDAIVITGSPI